MSSNTAAAQTPLWNCQDSPNASSYVSLRPRDSRDDDHRIAPPTRSLRLTNAVGLAVPILGLGQITSGEQARDAAMPWLVLVEGQTIGNIGGVCGLTEGLLSASAHPDRPSAARQRTRPPDTVDHTAYGAPNEQRREAVRRNSPFPTRLFMPSPLTTTVGCRRSGALSGSPPRLHQNVPKRG